MDYCPDPVDVSGVELPPALQADVERIARDVHEVWAQQRLQRGWGYGETLDTQRKTHPCLVEYDALPELEKDMDRATVTRTIKLLLWLGYQIEKRGDRDHDISTGDRRLPPGGAEDRPADQ